MAEQVVLSKEEKGEIAYEALLAVSLRFGIKLSGNMLREFESDAKKMGIPKEKFLLFTEMVVRDSVDRIFSKKK